MANAASQQQQVGSQKKKLKETTPRVYQTELFEQALERNVIAYLDTGAGKTFIAVLLINELLEALTNSNKKVVFLAPTVVLVNQQDGYLRRHVHARISRLIGEMKVDFWEGHAWAKALQDHDIFVMSPQILLNALRAGFVKITDIGLIIMDECHHVKGDYPSNRIMQEFYFKLARVERPKVYGMTASPLDQNLTKGKKKKGITNVAQLIGVLERNMDCKLVTVKDRKHVEEHAPTAQLLEVPYWPSRDDQELKATAERMLNAVALVKVAKERAYQREELQQVNCLAAQFPSIEEAGDMLLWDKEQRKSVLDAVANTVSKVAYSVEALGAWCGAACFAKALSGRTEDVDSQEFYRLCNFSVRKDPLDASVMTNELVKDMVNKCRLAGEHLRAALPEEATQGVADADLEVTTACWALVETFCCLADLLFPVQNRNPALLVEMKEDFKLAVKKSSMRQQDTHMWLAPRLRKLVDLVSPQELLAQCFDHGSDTAVEVPARRVVSDQVCKALQYLVSDQAQFSGDIKDAPGVVSSNAALNPGSASLDPAATVNTAASSQTVMASEKADTEGGTRKNPAAEQAASAGSKRAHGPSHDAQPNGVLLNAGKRLKGQNGLAADSQLNADPAAADMGSMPAGGQTGVTNSAGPINCTALSAGTTSCTRMTTCGGAADSAAATNGAADLKDASVDNNMGALQPEAQTTGNEIVAQEAAGSDTTNEKLSAWSCIIFVERRITAVALAQLMGALTVADPSLAWRLPCGMLTGFGGASVESMNSKSQMETLKRFQASELRVLVATSVAEEGLDLRSCQLVMRFDPPSNARAFVQSRGRARMVHSRMAILVNACDPVVRESTRLVTEYEQVMRRLAAQQSLCEGASSEDEDDDGELPPNEDEYTVPSTGALVSLASAKALLYHYCEKLPHDRYTLSRPRFRTSKVEASDSKGACTVKFKCKVILPNNAAVHAAEGTVQRKKRWAQASASLAACIALHKGGALTDHLVPVIAVLQTQIMEEEYLKEDHKGAVTVTPPIPKALTPPTPTPPDITPPPTTTLHIYNFRLIGAHSFDDRFALLHVHHWSVLLAHEIPSQLPEFPVWGVDKDEEAVEGQIRFEHCGSVAVTAEELLQLQRSHKYLLGIMMRLKGSNPAPVLEAPSPPDEWAAPSGGVWYVLAPLGKQSSPQSQGHVDWDLVQMLAKGEESIGNLMDLSKFKNYGDAAWRSSAQQLHKLVVGKLMKTAYNNLEYVCEGLPETEPALMVSSQFPDTGQVHPCHQGGTKKLKSRAGDDGRYETYADYYHKHHGLKGLLLSQPLLRAVPRRFAKSEMVSNFLQPPRFKRAAAAEGMEAAMQEAEMQPHGMNKTGTKETGSPDASRIEESTAAATTQETREEEDASAVNLVTQSSHADAPPDLNGSEHAQDLHEEEQETEEAEEAEEEEEDVGLGGVGEATGGPATEQDGRVEVELVPELCKVIPIPLNRRATIQCLPLLLHRLFWLLNAQELATNILLPPRSIHVVPVLPVLHAMTTRTASEYFSMERYETLGDTVLKFLTALYLYQRWANENEGELTTRKDWLVSNVRLTAIAKKHQLQHYLNSAPFEYNFWRPPGCRKTKSVPLQPVGSKRVADMMESLLGAVFHSCGLHAAVEMVMNFDVLPDSLWRYATKALQLPEPQRVLLVQLQQQQQQERDRRQKLQQGQQQQAQQQHEQQQQEQQQQGQHEQQEQQQQEQQQQEQQQQEQQQQEQQQQEQQGQHEQHEQQGEQEQQQRQLEPLQKQQRQQQQLQQWREQREQQQAHTVQELLEEQTPTHGHEPTAAAGIEDQPQEPPLPGESLEDPFDTELQRAEVRQALMQQHKLWQQDLLALARRDGEEPPSHAVDATPLEEKATGFQFDSSARHLVQEAMTHVTYTFGTTQCYQRMEYLGDAAIDFTVTYTAFLIYPDATPYMLTELRKALVSNEKLSYISFKTQLCKGLRHCSPELGNDLDAYLRQCEKAEEALAKIAQDGHLEPQAEPRVAAAEAIAIPMETNPPASVSQVENLPQPPLDVHPQQSPVHSSKKRKRAGTTSEDPWDVAFRKKHAPPVFGAPKVLADVVEALLAAVFLASKQDLRAVSRACHHMGILCGITTMLQSLSPCCVQSLASLKEALGRRTKMPRLV